MRKLVTVLSISLACISISEASAQIVVGDIPYTIGEPTVNGNGCPEGTFSVVASPDGDELSILFSAFTAQTSPTSIFGFSNCNIAVPLEVREGITVGLFGVDYRGLAYVPTGGTASLTREYFFAGSQGPTVTSNVTDYDTFTQFFFDDDVPFITFTGCGEDVIARSNATVMVTRPLDDPNNQALMSVFSEDFDFSIAFQFIFQECS